MNDTDPIADNVVPAVAPARRSHSLITACLNARLQIDLDLPPDPPDEHDRSKLPRRAVWSGWKSVTMLSSSPSGFRERAGQWVNAIGRPTGAGVISPGRGPEGTPNVPAVYYSQKSRYIDTA